jgi:catechol 2,3-dioxygenase-like lactoylglutathione lyase family enzyme
MSLAVKNLAASRAFYEKLGFQVFGGDADHHYLVLANGDARIGLFEGMFERNILTFNPGWDADCNALPEFTDVRELQARVKAEGLEPTTPIEEGSASGPASFVLVDPDGNPVLVDQHV